MAHNSSMEHNKKPGPDILLCVVGDSTVDYTRWHWCMTGTVALVITISLSCLNLLTAFLTHRMSIHFSKHKGFKGTGHFTTVSTKFRFLFAAITGCLLIFQIVKHELYERPAAQDMSIVVTWDIDNTQAGQLLGTTTRIVLYTLMSCQLLFLLRFFVRILSLMTKRGVRGLRQAKVLPALAGVTLLSALYLATALLTIFIFSRGFKLKVMPLAEPSLELPPWTHYTSFMCSLGTVIWTCRVRCVWVSKGHRRPQAEVKGDEYYAVSVKPVRFLLAVGYGICWQMMYSSFLIFDVKVIDAKTSFEYYTLNFTMVWMLLLTLSYGMWEAVIVLEDFVELKTKEGQCKVGAEKGRDVALLTDVSTTSSAVDTEDLTMLQA